MVYIRISVIVLGFPLNHMLLTHNCDSESCSDSENFWCTLSFNKV